ncbi:MAG TPA: zinc-dependent peptidase [Roseiflexaceae bacterium]|nr:zinc-dependent peptidase [Roseiflexaceae bacterium]
MMLLSDHWYQPVGETDSGLMVGGTPLPDGSAVYGAGVGSVSAQTLRAVERDYRLLVRDNYPPQLAGLMLIASGRPAAMRGYFPLLRALGAAEQDRFEARAVEASQRLDLRLFDRGRWSGVSEVDLPADAAYLVAGQIVELFFFRDDILEQLLAARTRIWLYVDWEAYRFHGGVGGGCYSPQIGAVQLVLSRLYEGFNGPMPGVAPLLHELGHLLDCFDPQRGRQGQPTGLYPGLRPTDGAMFTPAARAAFLRGKRIEQERYLRRCAGASNDEPLPLGHPYVFQNDGEFLAGYLELFFRSPHALARDNPALFAGYTTLFGQDPRRVWAEDFDFYLRENRRFYLESGEQPWPCGLTLPEDAY